MASRYQIITIIKNDTGIPSESGNSMYAPTYYPVIEAKIEDNYIVTGTEDRLDLIAFDYYGDSSLWWIIATANDLPGNSLYPAVGTQLRVPANYAQVIQDFASINNKK